MGKIIFKIACCIIGAALGVLVGHYAGLNMNEYLATDFFLLGEGHWTLEAGAPVLAIQAVEYLPAILGAVCGIVYSIRYSFLGVIAGPAIGFISGGIVGILAYLTCLVIGFFVTGTWLGILVLLALFAELGGPVYWVIVIPISRK